MNRYILILILCFFSFIGGFAFSLSLTPRIDWLACCENVWLKSKANLVLTSNDGQNFTIPKGSVMFHEGTYQLSDSFLIVPFVVDADFVFENTEKLDLPMSWSYDAWLAEKSL